MNVNFCKGLAILETLVFALGSIAFAEGPFSPDRSTVMGKVKKVAVLPTRVSLEVGDEDAVKQAYDRLIGHALSDGPFELIPATEFGSLFHETAVTMGGLYDPYTGEADVEKTQLILDHSYREFERLHEFDAYLIPVLMPVRVYWEHKTARWDGVEQPINTGKGPTKSGLFWGTVPGVSLAVLLRDREDDELLHYYKAGGVQLQMLFTDEWFSKTTFDDVPVDELCTDPIRNANAVDVALAGLLSASSDASALEDESPKAGAAVPTDETTDSPSAEDRS